MKWGFQSTDGAPQQFVLENFDPAILFCHVAHEMELQALLNEHDLQTQKQFVEQMGVSQQDVFNQPREMGKIEKTGIWVPHELNDG